MYTVLENKKIAKDVFNMVLEGDTSSIKCSGQFLNIEIAGFFLRRPIAVCDWDDKTIRLIYKVVGSGTCAMSNFQIGKKIDVLNGLGNGFNILDVVNKPLIIGGGIGIPPLYALSKEFIKRGIVPKVILGFESKDDIFLYEDFKQLGCEVIVSTIDGSQGLKGNVVDVIKDIADYDYFYACGPMAMLKAVCENTYCEGQLSLEEKMGCGFGSCLACSCRTSKGEKRICKEGPVFLKEELIW